MKINEKIKTIASVIAAVVMYFTPDNIDKIISLCFCAVYGTSQLLVIKKENKENHDKKEKGIH